MGDHRLATTDLNRIFRGETVSGLSEWQLLERYLEGRDEVAFEALVARHGPMVLGVCRRMLADHTDVDDAFQATFLVLVRRARQLGPRDAIGPWLHGVAARVAMRSRSESARRRRLQPISGDIPAIVDNPAPADREIGEVLDQELDRLPTKYRFPVVLCYLEGQTHEEAARQLKWPIGTVKGRLARARDPLRSRLVRRGLTPSVAALTLALSRDSSAAVCHELLDRTVRSSMKIALGQATAHVVSASITSLVEGVLTSMLLNTFKWAGMAVLVSGIAVTGVGVMARQNTAANHQETLTAPKTLAANAEPGTSDRILAENVATPNVNASNEQPKLVDLRKQLLKAAREEWEQAYKDYLGNNSGLERAYQASKRLMDAEEAVASPPDDKANAVKGQFERMRELARTQHSNPSSNELQSAQIRAYAAEAELWLAQAKTTEAKKDREESSGANVSDERGRDPQSRRILAKLDDRIPMSFATETPLEDFLKYVKQVTASPENPGGLPIYVDPVGLQEAEKTMNSTVIIDLEGVPLRRTLQLVLKQLDLIYFVDDGMIYITSSESEDQPLGPPMRGPSPVMLRIAKAERGELTEREMKELVEFLKTREEVMRLSSELGGGGIGTRDEAGKHTPATSEESKQNKELVELLIKETKELMEMLDAAKAAKKPAESKAGLQ